MDALQASGAGDQAGQVAWVLIYRALMQATADLVTDAADLFLLADPGRLPDASAQEALGAVLADHLLHCEARIDSEFFAHPERFGLLADFKPGFSHWLQGLGLDPGSAAALAGRLPDRFTLALHGEWLKEPERFAVIGQAIDSPFHPRRRPSPTLAEIRGLAARAGQRAHVRGALRARQVLCPAARLLPRTP